MVSNSFGKSVSFVLESCGLTTPDNCDDNYICGACVRDNEAALRLKCSSRITHSSVTPQEVDIGKVPLPRVSKLKNEKNLKFDFVRYGKTNNTT